MSDRSVLDLIAASGPFPDHAEQLMLYGRFVGAWDVQATWHDPEKGRRTGCGQWHFGWVLGGRGVQDVLFAAGAPPHQYGTTLRCYDPVAGVWHVCWMQPGGGEFAQLVGRRVGAGIVQEGYGPDRARRLRWSFTDIAADSFRWRGEVSVDDGRTWTVEQEMTAFRRREP